MRSDYGYPYIGDSSAAAEFSFGEVVLDGEENVLALADLSDQFVPFFVLILAGEGYSDFDCALIFLGGYAQYFQIGKTWVIYG